MPPRPTQVLTAPLGPVVPLSLWLVFWAAFGLPWGEVRRTPHVKDVQWNLNPLRRPDDVLRNVAFYVPFGALCAATTPLAGTAVLAATLSGATEVAQLFAESRVPSVRDFVLNTCGAFCGWTAMVMWQRPTRKRIQPLRN